MGSLPRQQFAQLVTVWPGRGTVRDRQAKLEIRTHRPIVGLLVAAMALTAAGLAVEGVTDPTLVDRGLPLVTLLILVAGWLTCSERLGGILAMGVPVLVALAVAAPDDRIRLAGYGVVFAAVVFGAGWSILRDCAEIQEGSASERDGARRETGRQGDAGSSRRSRNEADDVVPPQDGSAQPLSEAPGISSARAIGLLIVALIPMELLGIDHPTPAPFVILGELRCSAGPFPEWEG